MSSPAPHSGSGPAPRSLGPRADRLLVSAFALLVGLGITVGLSCGGDEVPESRPEPPPPMVDAGGDGAGDDTQSEGCPEGEPKVGDNCRTAGSEDTCNYEAGSCTVDGQMYTKRASYRCFGGNWIKWPQPEKSPCDE
jgi:hypothetical protein